MSYCYEKIFKKHEFKRQIHIVTMRQLNTKLPNKNDYLEIP